MIFGLPFRNPGHFTDDWINKGSVVASSMTFVDILRQRIPFPGLFPRFGRLRLSSSALPPPSLELLLGSSKVY